MTAAHPLQEFLAMGGYGAYVWPAYAVTVIVIAGMAAHTLLSAQRQRERLRALERRTSIVMKAGRLIPLIVAAAALGLGAFALLRGKPEPVDSMIGKTPDAVSLEPLVNGAPRAALPLVVKGPAMVNFWASWCTPCRAEHPFVSDLAKKSGVPLIGVAYRDAPSAAAAYLKELGDPYKEIRLDPEGQAGFNFGIKGVPETFVIGADGAILARVSGPLTPQIIENAIAPALQRAKTTASR